MPMQITTTAGGVAHSIPFVGPVQHTDHVKLDVSEMSDKEVDENGYLKPGVPLTSAGILVGASPAYPHGCSAEAQRVASGNTDAILDAATDVLVTVVTHGIVNRDILEDILGRALTANEIAGFDRAGSHLRLTTT